MNLQQKVYDITRQIPKGKVATYGQIAKIAGIPKAARFVGYCMKNNTDIPTTPCHRVVAADGNLRGYSYGTGIPQKKKLLLSEGVYFINEKVDLSRSKWHPY